MCLMRIRSGLAGRHGSLFGIVVVMLIGLVVFVAHSEPSAHDMEADVMGMSDAMSICLAILQFAEVFVVARLVGSYRRRLRAPRVTGKVATSRFLKFFDNPGHLSREGPSVLQVFRN